MEKNSDRGLLSQQGLIEGRIRPNDVFIAIMGMTGAGKSTFISTCAPESGVEIGNNLEACTQEIGYFEMPWSKEITVWLIDTPGFDDTYRSDTDVLKEIATSLSALHGSDIKLHGIIYLHQITENRIRGSAMRNVIMFRKLCGSDFYKNVILATTMWSKVDPAEGSKREIMLEEKDDYWGDMKRNGSRIFRHDGSYESAKSLVSSLFKKTPKALALQEELSKPQAELSKTAAGREVEGEIGGKRREAEQALEGLKAELKEARETHDKAYEAQVKKLKAQEEDRIAQLLQQQKDLKSSIEVIIAEKEKSMQEEVKRERQKRQEADIELAKVKLRHRDTVEDLQSQLKKLNTNPKVRAAPGANKMGRWSVSFSLFGDMYWFDASTSDFGTPLQDFPEERKPFPTVNGNRCVAFGAQQSWVINYRETQNEGEYEDHSICSENFGRLYPGAHQYLVKAHPNESTTCVSLGTDGHYFVRTASGVSCNLPDSILNKIGLADNFQSVWLGHNGAFVAQRQIVNETTRKVTYVHKMYLQGYDPMLQRLINLKKMRIHALALNPLDPSQWVVLWPDGSTAYSKEHMAFDQLTYENFCSVNFGTRWDNSAANNFGDAAEDAPMGLLVVKEGRRKWYSPWRRKPNEYAVGEI